MWAVPGIKKAIGDDFYATPFPKFDDQGKFVTFMGGWAEFVNAKGKHIDESKAFTKWLWIDNTEDQKDWALSYGFHIPPRLSVAKAAAPLQASPAKDITQYYYDYGRGEGPLMDSQMWTYFNNAVANIVKNGADPKAELDNAQKQCQAELDKVLA
jgi:multiple sugar transport system substrate-binding protein